MQGPFSDDGVGYGDYSRDRSRPVPAEAQSFNKLVK